MAKTIFEKIIDREIPAKIAYEDDDVIAFYDISPQAPVHIVVTTKKVYTRLAEVPESHALVLGKLLIGAQKAAKAEGLDESGFRVVINNRGPDVDQEVLHIHAHVLGGRHMSWPPG
jgi:histidine triad (HIT) family protein